MHVLKLALMLFQLINQKIQKYVNISLFLRDLIINLPTSEERHNNMFLDSREVDQFVTVSGKLIDDLPTANDRFEQAQFWKSSETDAESRLHIYKYSCI